METRLGSVNRVVAMLLALAWACAGVAGLVAAYLTGGWLAAAAAILALGYAVLWARVGVQARLLTWSEFVTPWRAR